MLVVDSSARAVWAGPDGEDSVPCLLRSLV